jgi:DNA-binding PadR family transcriptional regulator
MPGGFVEFEKAKRTTRAPKKHRGPSAYLTLRDRLMMLYIWKWKIASTASVHEAVNRPASPYSAYKTLERLEQNHFVECRFEFAERFYVWQLTERGFHAIKGYLGELKEDGYLSENHRHDRLVQAFQLGEWATHQFNNVSFCTEQDLRRREVVDYPEWVPQSSDHRPDGYTRIVGAKKTWTIAFEAELSAKNVQKYEGILRFYRTVRVIDRVLWLVESKAIRDTILRAKDCIRDDSTNYHVFVDLADFEKNGWDAQVTNERSENLFTLREKYQGICGDTPAEILGNLKGQSKVTVHLANQKVIGKSKA